MHTRPLNQSVLSTNLEIPCHWRPTSPPSYTDAVKVLAADLLHATPRHAQHLHPPHAIELCRNKSKSNHRSGSYHTNLDENILLHDKHR